MSVIVVRKEGQHVRIRVGAIEVMVLIQEVFDGEVTLAIASPAGVSVNSARDIKN